tara:strand:+ start:3950 stop:4087 length:138 start_codon:yes stop_codon:yes gene_type:complete
MSRRSIWIPPEELKGIKKAAENATASKGIGAYLVKLHKQEENRKK